MELFHGPIHDHELFVSPTGVSGFVTGDMGLGHVVLGTTNLHEAVDFYTNVLGFRVSDYMNAGADDVVFIHCNPRHHSLALVAAPESVLYHFMLEARTLDDVGYTLDRHQSQGVPISRGLGCTRMTRWSRSTARHRPGSKWSSAAEGCGSTTPPGLLALEIVSEIQGSSDMQCVESPAVILGE